MVRRSLLFFVFVAFLSFWVFYGGMTDFAYTVTVTDLVESREKTYTKEPYKLCGGADTAAFP